MKKLLWMMLYAILGLMPFAAQAQEELTIVHVTDMHYLSPSLTDYGAHFMQVISDADGKVTHYTPQLMQAFVEEMRALEPDAIILSGDLTLNGAPHSHAELAACLAQLADAGIQVLALPGNHDTGAAAYRFSGEEIIAVDGMADADFADAYEKLGYADALTRDASSQSYVAQLAPDVWCLLLDVNANGTAGTVNEDTLLWAEEQLQAAQEKGIIVISVTHQPALVHNSLFTFGYVINNASRLTELYTRYGVQLNLCGHLHMQHVARSGALTEIAASSLAVSPHQYGVLRVQGNALVDYRMEQLDVAGWAARSASKDANLLGFADYSVDFFARTTQGQLEAMLAESGISEQEQEQMKAFAVRLNAEYFAGARTLTADDPAWALWETHLPNSFFIYYLRSILSEAPQDMRSVDFSQR